jgi:hypothetical protein
LYLQLALVLHNPQSANEVFLLSLRDCVLALPDDHSLREWFKNKNLKNQSAQSLKIKNILETELQDVWSKNELKPAARRSIVTLLGELDEKPPYLDYTILRAAGYLKLGNWARSEKIILDWIDLHPIERIKKTPWRYDTLGDYTKTILPELIGFFRDDFKNQFVVDVFLLAIEEFYNSNELLNIADDYNDLSQSDFNKKFRLKYNSSLTPSFSMWFKNNNYTKKRYSRFIEDFFANPDFKNNLWVFLEKVPANAKEKELLAKQISYIKSEQKDLFYKLCSNQEMKGVMSRTSPELLKNILKEKRQYYLQEFEKNNSNHWALAQLIEMGQINERLIKQISKK